MEERTRAHLFISGRVQGVCYRMETKFAAERIGGVCGWVRNLRDGRVEALIEGPRKQVDALIEWCRNGPAAARVSGVDIQWEPDRNEFTDFEVTY